MRLSWHDLGTSKADRVEGRTVEISGWPVTVLPTPAADHFLLMAEPGCCAGCVPNNPLAVVEIVAGRPIKLGDGRVRLKGRWHVATDPEGWRYQLLAAELLPGLSRRAVLAASPLLCLPVPALAQATDGMAADIHSHAGNLIRASYSSKIPLLDVATPMRQGGLSAICLAIVGDSPIISSKSGRIRPVREPHPGELYDFSKVQFAKLHELARSQSMPIVKTAADLRVARSSQPSVIVTSEGGDWLEGKIERLDEAYQRWQLRQLQLTHYHPNELGDIQTEPAVHGGLTDFGAEVIRRCNTLGIVVDVAHGTFDLVKRAVATTAKPLVLSHTALSNRPYPWTRLITTDHARAIASTGGVIGIWPVAEVANVSSYADHISRMVDAVGIDHVGMGTDQLGLLGPSCLPSYADLPQLAAALSSRFKPAEISKLLGGNYRRVFEACIA
ncbi:MAG TPA: membrane dipeptidase [Reyranella sp.]|nr:membrane dipeptidase [Reyranella sp.]